MGAAPRGGKGAACFVWHGGTRHGQCTVHSASSWHGTAAPSSAPHLASACRSCRSTGRPWLPGSASQGRQAQAGMAWHGAAREGEAARHARHAWGTGVRNPGHGVQGIIEAGAALQPWAWDRPVACPPGIRLLPPHLHRIQPLHQHPLLGQGDCAGGIGRQWAAAACRQQRWPSCHVQPAMARCWPCQVQEIRCTGRAASAAARRVAPPRATPRRLSPAPRARLAFTTICRSEVREQSAASGPAPPCFAATLSTAFLLHCSSWHTHREHLWGEAHGHTDAKEQRLRVVQDGTKHGVALRAAKYIAAA